MPRQPGREFPCPCLRGLAQWDRGANLDSGSGFVYFQRFMQRFAELDGAWKEPFDAQRPLDTPQGIALDRPQVATQVRQALADAAAEVEKSGIPDGARWGDLQVSTRGQERIAIPGGDGHFGVYNAIQSVRKGDLEVVGGTSYIQLVTFPRKAQGSRVAGFLPVQRSALAALPRPDRAVFPPAMADLAVQRQADRRRPATATAKHSRMISNAYQI